MTDVYVPHPQTKRGLKRLVDTGEVEPISGLPVYSDEASLTPQNGGVPVTDTKASTLVVNRLALSVAAQLVIAANASRIFAEIRNLDLSISIYWGKDNTVTAANGILLKPGEPFGFDRYTGDIWAIAVSGTPALSSVWW